MQLLKFPDSLCLLYLNEYTGIDLFKILILSGQQPSELIKLGVNFLQKTNRHGFIEALEMVVGPLIFIPNVTTKRIH